MPITFWTFLISTLAIAGIAAPVGFFSKDAILWEASRETDGIALLWVHRRRGRGAHRLLHVPPGLHDLPRRVPRRSPHAGPPARVAAGDDACRSSCSPAGGVAGCSSGSSACRTFLGGSNRFEAWLAAGVRQGHRRRRTAPRPHEHATHVDARSSTTLMAALGRGRGRSASCSRVADLPSPQRSSPDRVGDARRRRARTGCSQQVLRRRALPARSSSAARCCCRGSAAWFDSDVDRRHRQRRAPRSPPRVSWLNGRFDNYVVDGAGERLLGEPDLRSAAALRRLQTGSINAYLYVIVVAVVGRAGRAQLMCSRADVGGARAWITSSPG